MISLSIRELLQDKEYFLSLEALTGPIGLSKKIMIPQIQKPGLALTGYTSNLHPGRIQVLGGSEIDFLNKLSSPKRSQVLGKICRVDIACFVITQKNRVPRALLKEALRQKIPVLATALSTAVFIMRVSRFLEDRLTETTNIHGVLLDVLGVGILLIGKSGIGKSECALELIMKGHRLVADDIVHIRKKAPSSIYGIGPELIKYHMEIRGLGIINIKDLFGVASVRDQKLVELVIEFLEWNSKQEYERLGIDQRNYDILGVRIPFIRLPIRPGRSLTSIIEVAARNQLLKLKGFYSAQEFQEKLTRQLLAGETNTGPLKEILE